MCKAIPGKALWNYNVCSRRQGSIGIGTQGIGSFFAAPDASEDELHAKMLENLHRFGLEWMPGNVAFTKVSE